MKTLTFIQFLNLLNLEDQDLTICIFGRQMLPFDAINEVCKKDDPNDGLFWNVKKTGKYVYECIKS